MRDGSFDYAKLSTSRRPITERAVGQSMIQVGDQRRSSPTRRRSTSRSTGSRRRRSACRSAMRSTRSAPTSARATSASSTSSAACSRSTCRRRPPRACNAESLQVSAGAQQRRQHGAARHAGIDQDRRRPLGDQPLQSLPGRNRRCHDRAWASAPVRASSCSSRSPRRRCRRAAGYEWTAMSYQEKEIGNQIYLIYALSLLLVYLVLAGQYESWIAPATVIVSVPLALLGTAAALLALGVAQQPLHADRPHPAHRAVEQERHPHRRVRPRAAHPRGQGHPSKRGRRGGAHRASGRS